MLNNLDFHLLAVAASWGCGAFSAWAFIDFLLKSKRAREMAQEEIIVTETKSGFFRAFMPLARKLGKGMRGALDRQKELAEKPGFYRQHINRLKAKLASAGHPEAINADEYMGFWLINIFIYGAAGVLCFLLLEPFPLLTMFFAGMVVGATRMPAWLKSRTNARHTHIRKQLPFALDLLTLAIEAGLDFTSALDRINRKLGTSALGQEFQFMLREIRLGKSRSDAMRDLGRRVGVLEVQSVMTSLVQAEEMGSSIGPILRIQAEQQRERRSQRAEEVAGKMPVKMLLPLLMFLGVTMLLIFGSMAVKYFI